MKAISVIEHPEWSLQFKPPHTALLKKSVLLKSQELYHELESSGTVWSLPHDGDVFAHLCQEFILESLISDIFKKRWYGQKTTSHIHFS